MLISAHINLAVVRLLADVGAPTDGTSSNFISDLVVGFFGLGTVLSPGIIGWHMLGTLAGKSSGAEKSKAVMDHIKILAVVEAFFGGVWTLVGRVYGFVPSFL